MKDDDFKYDPDGDDELDEGGEDPNHSEIMDHLSINLAETELSQKLLHKAISVAREDWLWWFRRPSKKVRIIEKIYYRLMGVLEP